jgi:hypothetical protein
VTARSRTRGKRERLAAHGCPVGSLTSELDKRTDDLHTQAAAVLEQLAGFAQRQFEAMGRPDARELAVALVAAYEGIALLANTLGDPGLVSVEGRRLERWIDDLAHPAPLGRDRGTASWAAAHPADEVAHVDAVRYGPCRRLFTVNRVGQVAQGLVSHLRQSCLAQNVNHMLPGDLHGNHRTLASCANRCANTTCAPRSGV